MAMDSIMAMEFMVMVDGQISREAERKDGVGGKEADLKSTLCHFILYYIILHCIENGGTGSPPS